MNTYVTRFFVSLKSFVLRRRLVAAVLAIGVIYGGYFFLSGPPNPVYETYTVSKGDITEKVSVTGKIKPVKYVDLGFERSGRIAQIYRKDGSAVAKGDALIRLENDDMYANVLQAQATLAVEQATLDQLKKGARDESIAVSETKVRSAETSLAEAKKNLGNAVQDAFTKSDDAVRNQVDDLFSNPRSSSPLLVVNADIQLKTNVEWERFAIEKALIDWENALAEDTLSETILSVDSVHNNLDMVQSFLNDMSLIVNDLKPISGLSSTVIDTYKAGILAARTNVHTAITNLNTSEEKLSTAQSALEVASQELVLVQAPATQEDIAAQEARVQSANSQVANTQAQLRKTVLTAPFSGVVTKQDARVGEIISTGVPIVSLVSDSAFQIELFIPEADIAKVSVGDTAEFTLDAYTDDVMLEGEVSSIESAETVVEGVSTYKTLVSFTDTKSIVRSGMTANVDIITETKHAVRTVPARALQFGDTGSYLRVLHDDGTVEKRNVLTGIRNTAGFVEITNGVSEGDVIIVFEK